MARLGSLRISGTTVEALKTSLVTAFAEVSKAFRQINFENFESFTVDLDLAASEEIYVINRFGKDKQGFIPRYWMIVDTTTGGSLKKSGTWTSQGLFLTNASATDPFIGTVMFIR